MKRKIKCHQYLGGRFHEGYGRIEISKAEKDGRVKQTIDYEAMNLEGRNSFIHDQYCAFELVPTHVDWKQPGVFCITNNTENGSQAARTYGIIPESGEITDAFDILLTKPVLPLEEFTLYDLGEKQLTWLEKECEEFDQTYGYYSLSERARLKLGQFIAAFWEAMSIRMNDPDTDEKIVLKIDVHRAGEDEPDPFPYLVRFFASEIVSRLPEAVRPMTSVSFGVPWAKRNSHKGVVCYVQTDDRDIRTNQIFRFSLDTSSGMVDVSEDSNIPAVEESMQNVAAVLMKGSGAYPEVYQRLVNHFGDHLIVKSYDVFELLVESELWKQNLMSLDRNTRTSKVRKFISGNKKQYFDSLYYTLTKNCKCSSEEAFNILLPTLQNILEVMGDIEPGTEFQNGFTDADIPFFAACRKEVTRMEQTEPIANQLDQILIQNYQAWGEMNFAASFLRKQSEDQDAFPQDVFLSITEEAFKSGNIISKDVVDKVREYIRQNYKLNYSSDKHRQFAFTLMSYEDGSKIKDETIASWGDWLIECSEIDVRKDIAPYAAVLLQWLEKSGQSDLGDKKIAGICETLTKSSAFNESVYGKAEQLLIDHFCSWSQTGFMVDPGDRKINKEVFYPIACKWLRKIEKEPEVKLDKTKEDAIAAIRQYCQDNPQENDVCLIAEEIFRYLCKTEEITKEIYSAQQEWLQDACGINEKRAFVLLLILADKLFIDANSMNKAGIELVGDHMDELTQYSKNRKYETAVDIDALLNRETEFLIVNFAKWRQIENEKDFIRYQDIDILRTMVEQWQKEGMLESNLGFNELQMIHASLADVKSKDGKRLELSALEKYMTRVQLQEAVSRANKEKDYSADVLINISGIRQNLIKSGLDENDEDIANASRILITHFYEWSKTGFETGEDEPDDSFVKLTREWVESINPNKISYNELDAIAETLSGINCINKAKDKTFLEDLKKKSFDSMKTQSKNPDLVNADGEWLERLVEFYSDEDTDEASNQRKDICKRLSEAYARGKGTANKAVSEKAEKHIREILENHQYKIPDEAKKDEVWIDIRKGLMNNALEQFLARFSTVRELTDQKLQESWDEDYAKEYSTSWRDLSMPAQSDYESVISRHFAKIYSEKSGQDKVDLLREIWNISSGNGRNSRSIGSIERSFAIEKFDNDYNTLWIDANASTRKSIDDLFSEMAETEPLDDAKRSDARKASQYIANYGKLKLQEEEVRALLKQATEFPEWMKFLHADDINNPDSAINMMNRRQDVSVLGIGMRLIHDLTINQAKDGSYWDALFQSLAPGNISMGQLAKMNPWTTENSRILNTFSFLSIALSELGEGGERAADDLKKRLSTEAPGFMAKLTDEQLATKLWDGWEKIIPDNKIFKMFIRPI